MTNQEVKEEQFYICKFCYNLEECPMYKECLEETKRWMIQRQKLGKEMGLFKNHYERTKI